MESHPVNAVSAWADVELDAWGDAYRKVAANLRAYGLRNPLIISRLTLEILETARCAEGADGETVSPVERAARALDRRFADWSGAVLRDPPTDTEGRLARGRIAWLLCDGARRWPAGFLQGPPFDPAFLEAMNSTRLTTGPALVRQGMAPMPIEFHPVTRVAGSTLEQLARWPALRFTALLLLLAAAAFAVISFAR